MLKVSAVHNKIKSLPLEENSVLNPNSKKLGIMKLVYLRL